MTATEVKEKVVAIHKSEDPKVVDALVAELMADGWDVGLYAYCSLNTQTKSRPHRTLKRPRREWRYVGYWFKGDDKVWYYNNPAVDKQHATTFAKAHPLPERFHEKIRNSFSNPNLVVLG